MTTARERGEGSASRPGRFTPGKDPVPIVQEAGWAPGPVWTGAENLAPTGVRSPDLPARSQSLYRLSYPAHTGKVGLLERCCIKYEVMMNKKRERRKCVLSEWQIVVDNWSLRVLA